MNTCVRIRSIVLLLALLIAALLPAWADERPVLRIDAPPPVDFPAKGFSHQVFEDLLQRFVVNGRVNYDAWHGDADAMAALESYLAAVGRWSPDNAPERFADKNDAKAYWLYVYNAFVLKAVLDRWPLDSVNDVRAPAQIAKGQGFFYRLHFIAGGEEVNLLRIQKKKVKKQWRDPRAHFVLNCASDSCPILRPELPTGDELEPFLAQSARDFVSEPSNVSIDHTAQELRVSEIFKWYRKEFIRDLRSRGLPSSRGIVDYLIDVAPDELKGELERAANYTVVYFDYDWDINQAGKETS
ncbi:MAG: DUF547 domain-containing protein [Pseudomonadota bacterium]|nr:MAG: DUF547 domain-containing protein [Pseudomonadota bacterium]